MLPILKKGKPTGESNSYRPFSMVSLISKVLMLVLHARLPPMVEDTVGEYQNLFRNARSTTDAIFTLQQMCEKYRQKQDGKLFVCFIDLTQAFDRVNWDMLWHCLNISGIPGPYSGCSKQYTAVPKFACAPTHMKRSRTTYIQPQACAKDACSHRHSSSSFSNTFYE